MSRFRFGFVSGKSAGSGPVAAFHEDGIGAGMYMLSDQGVARRPACGGAAALAWRLPERRRSL